MDNKSLVKSIKNLCKKKNILISQLENDLNFGSGLISRWNKSSPSIDKIIEIAKYFKVSVDEVIGFDNIIDDEFLKILIDKTVNRNIIWQENNDIRKEIPKNHYKKPPTKPMFNNEDEYLEYINAYKEKFYFTQINEGSVIIYAQYFNLEIVRPNILKLFIQPTYNSKLIYQMYNLEQLSKLWLKILYSTDGVVPDEILAEIFKNELVENSKRIKC